MSNFIRDNTSPGDVKTDYRTTSIPVSQKFAAVDYERFRQALLDIQTYLRSGLLDAATTTTLKDIDLVLSADPSAGPEMDWAGNRGRWFVGVDVANAPTSRDFVITGQRIAYSLPDGATTSGSPTLTSASGGNFVAALIGAAISGAGIPAGTTITAVSGLTSLTMSANATATAAGVSVTITTGTSQDLAYWKHRGGLSATLGIGVTPPDGLARLQVSAQDNEPAMATVRLRRGPAQTGNVLTLHDSTPTDRMWVDKDFYLTGNNASVGGAIAIAGDVTNQRTLCMTGSDKANVYGFSLPTGSGGVLRFSCISGGNNVFDAGTDGSLRHLSAKLGFFGAATVTKPAVTGSRGGNAALASLITALANLGLITDSTTA